MKLTAASAQAIAWLCVAVINALFIRIARSEASLRITLLEHLYDAGHVALLGLACVAGTVAWQRWGSRRGQWIALAAIAFAVDGIVLLDDLTPRATILAKGKSPAAWLVVMTAIAALTVVGAAWAGKVARRPVLRQIAAAGALYAAVANQMLLERDYPGVHLHVSWLAAMLLGASLTDMRWPERLRLPPRARWGLAVALTGLAAWSVLARPPTAVLVRMLSRSGGVLAPFVGRAHAWWAMRGVSRAQRRHDNRPDVPPSTPRIVPDDAVVVFVTIDALRADIIADDAHAALLPNLHALRREGAWFTTVRTPAPATIVALTSVFTGAFFSELYWSNYRDGWQAFPHRDERQRVSEILSDAGVTTVVVHGCEWMKPDTGVLGRFDEDIYLEPNSDLAYAEASRLMESTVLRLKAHREGALFLYMHWLEPHAPYTQAGSEGTDYERYLREIAMADRELGKLREALSAPRLANRAALIVASDHGEAFGEHATHFHGLTIYEEQLLVPLLISLPGLAPKRHDTPVSLIDVGATILDLFGQATPGAFSSRSLIPVMRGEPWDATLPVVIDSGRHMRAMIFADGYKIIRDRRRGTTELYDLGTDAGESRNLIEALPGEADARTRLLMDYFAERELVREGYVAPFRRP